MKYKSLLFDKGQKPQAKVQNLNLEDIELLEGEILIQAEYSGINYKDALGFLGQGPIFKTNPIIPGIDVSGHVIETKSDKFQQSDLVLVNGMGLGEDKNGGFSEYVKVHESCVLPLPKGLSLREAMILGTAGFTAGLAIDRMIQNGQSFDKGPILVSGASGGVGSFAVQILAQLGFMVEATTSRQEQFQTYLEDLGAHYVSHVSEVMQTRPPLAKAQWGGVIDNLGGEFIQSVLPAINLWGNIASIGLAQGAKLNTTVMPFILRGVSLLGASSNNCTMEKRLDIWQKLAKNWKPHKIEELVTNEVSLEGILTAGEQILNHKNHGRILVRL